MTVTKRPRAGRCGPGSPGWPACIRHIQKIRTAHQLTQQVPGGDVRRIIHDVAAVAGEVDGHTPIVADCQRVQQLFEIRPMVFVVSPGDGVRGSAQTQTLFGRLVVGPVERDRGRVIVKFSRPTWNSAMT